MPEIIARRSLLIDNDDAKRLEVNIYAPTEDGPDYRCLYEIIDVGRAARSGYALGVDSLQALLLAIQRAGVDVAVSQYAKEKRLFWNGQNDDLGVPLPKSAEGP